MLQRIRFWINPSWRGDFADHDDHPRDKNRLCVFNPDTNDIVDFLRHDESELEALVRLERRAPNLIVLPVHQALQHRAMQASARPQNLLGTESVAQLQVTDPQT
jgi:hypothetical protein